MRNGKQAKMFINGGLNCNKTKDFLNDNIYPIINKINNSFLKSVQKDFKITIILFYHHTNLNQINFIHNQFKN